MNYIDSVEIDGFWGDKRVYIKFNDDLNFLIGPNGSGKTTVINLISAALRSDLATLYSIQFTEIAIKLKTIGANKKPIIVVSKSTDPDMGSLSVKYLSRRAPATKGKSTASKARATLGYIETTGTTQYISGTVSSAANASAPFFRNL